MSDPLVLANATASGAATVREVAAPGMITLKGDLGSADVAAAVHSATGCAMPGVREVASTGAARALWMAPDELLLILARDNVAEALTTLGEALSGTHTLITDVSDMRAVFRIESGVAARETVAKLCPVDLAPGAFEPGEIRRTRLAQIPAAFWMEDNGFTFVCFRSVAQYAFDALSGAAAADARVNYFSEA